jgi:hypothetical protein
MAHEPRIGGSGASRSVAQEVRDALIPREELDRVRVNCDQLFQDQQRQITEVAGQRLRPARHYSRSSGAS